MSQPSFSITRRALLATAAASGAVSLLPAASKAKSGSAAIRPFKVEVPQADIDDLRRRLASTRWPDRETVEARHKVFNSTPCDRSSNTGRPTTTGAKPRRS